MKKAVLILMTLIIVSSSSFAFADGAAIIADTVVLRPLGLAALATGSTVYVLTLPFTALTGSAGKSFNALVKEPYRFTFVRPYGELDYKTDRKQ
jgi:hypothetical protein